MSATTRPRVRVWTSVGMGIVALAAFGTIACSEAVGPARGRDIGVLDLMSQYPGDAVRVPSPVTAGVEFPVVVRTVGNGCVRAAGATLAYEGAGQRTAVIVPYDSSIATPRTACPDILVQLERTVLVRFVTPGEGTVLVRGRGWGGDSLITVATSIQVTAP